MKFLTNLDLNRNELQNAVLQPLAAAPSNPRTGQIYFSSTDKCIYVYNGTQWTVAGTIVEESDVNGYIKIGGEDTKVYELPAATATILGGIKIGDGLTVDNTGKASVIPHEHYEVTKAQNATIESALATAYPTASFRDGDTAVGKTLITGTTDKYSYTAYVYTDGAWHAMDGNYNAGNVYFDEDMVFTKAYGKYTLTNGQVTIPSKGMNLIEHYKDAFAEDTPPTVTYPTVSFSVPKTSYEDEVGSTYTLPTATFKVTGVGNYTYGSYKVDASGNIVNGTDGKPTFYAAAETGVTFAKGDVTISEGSDNSNSNTSAALGKNGTLTLTADDDSTTYTDNTISYTFSASAKYTSSDRVPITALKVLAKNKQIGYTGASTTNYTDGTSGTGTMKISDKSVSYTGWRRMFIGSVASKTTAITSALIRGFIEADGYSTKMVSGSTIVNPNYASEDYGDKATYVAPSTHAKVIIACPYEYELSAVQLKGLSWGNFNGFTETTPVSVADYRGGNNGLKQYRIYTYTPTGDNLGANCPFSVSFKTATA